MNLRVPSALFLTPILLTTLLSLAGCSGADADSEESVDDEAAELSSQAGERDMTIADKVGVRGFKGHYASPSIVRVDATYHAYFAEQTFGGRRYHIPHATFTADGKFTTVGDALPKVNDNAEPFPVWAPAVAKVGEHDWVLYYSAHQKGTAGKMCTYRAHSNDANGPFVDNHDGPIVCGDASHWAIDPYLVQNGDGDWFLAVRYDLPGHVNTIRARRLAKDAMHFADGSSWSELTHNAPNSWEQPVLENAGLVRVKPPNGEAHWLVFYSGRAWANDSYAIGYADCGPSIAGPCVKKTPNGPWMHSDLDKKLYGPGTPTFYTNEAGDTLMSIQAWQHPGGKANKNNNGQIMHTYSLTVDDDYTPHVKLVRTDT